MDGTCLRYTQLPGTSRLFADYLYDFDKASQFYWHAPGKAESFAASAAAIDYPATRREALVAALSRINPRNSPNLKKLAEPGTFAVVTGQQVGLFSGPAYTVFKALTAVAVARQLTANGTPAVPVFWLATEDHDFPEVAAAHAFDAAANIHTLRVSTSGPADRPVGGIVPDNGFPIDALESALQGFEHAGEVMALVREAHAASPSMGGAFRELLQRLLRDQDLIFIDPLDEGIRAIGAPFLRHAIQNGAALGSKLLDRNQALTDAGYHAQVHVEADTSLFFLLESGRRIALKRQDDCYVSKDLRLTVSELAARAEAVSPNALLRPVLQDFLLPTIAYVGGPAELAYFAQSEVLYRGLLGRMPVMLPRNGFTLLGTRANKLLARYGFTLTDALVRHEDLRARVAATLLPATLHATLADTSAGVRQLMQRLDSDLLAFDPSLARSLQKSQSKIEYQLGKIERKAARQTFLRDERARHESQHLSNMLFPHEHLQERFFSILPFLAQHGFGLIDQISLASGIDCVDHHIMPV